MGWVIFKSKKLCRMMSDENICRAKDSGTE